MLLNKFAASIGGASVDYEPFIVSEGLTDYALVCFLQSLKIVEVDGDDGYFHDDVSLPFYHSLYHTPCSLGG